MNTFMNSALRARIRPALLCLIAMGIVMALAAPVHAAGNFIIEKYDIDMVVNEDDTYLITETLDVHFTASSHGIYRTIPYRTELDRDGQRSLFFAGVSDFTMLSGQPWSQEKSGAKYTIRIGDPDVYAEEDTVYKFSYVFDNKGDHLKDADEVYYNLVGTDWEAQSIDEVRFQITFPKDIDMTKVGMKTGYQEDVSFETEGSRVISGTTTLDTRTGLTLRAVLPEGYFTKQATNSSLLFYLLAAALVVMTGIGFVLWRRYGRDPDVVVTEEFYPPEGLTSADIGYLKEGTVTGDHVISTLLTLADEGYLKIKESQIMTGRKKNKPKASYEISMVRGYNGEDAEKQVFMDGLFDHGTTPVVTVKSLENKFYKTVEKIEDLVEKKFDGKLYDARAGHYAGILRTAAVIALAVLFILSKVLNGSPLITDAGLITSILLFIFQVAAPALGFYMIGDLIAKGRRNPLLYLLWLAISAGGIGFAGICETFLSWQTIPFLIGAGMCLLLNIMAGLCERKTEYYADLLGKIRGYERFLKVAEKEKMEMLAEQDPGYFYRNLAFAFALGVTGVYASRFAILATRPPEWYDSPYTYHSGSVFNATDMMGSMSSMLSSATSSMTSSPSDGGGGGSFSGGGGGGGGGGGSW